MFLVPHFNLAIEINDFGLDVVVEFEEAELGVGVEEELSISSEEGGKMNLDGFNLSLFIICYMSFWTCCSLQRCPPLSFCRTLLDSIVSFE